MRAALTACALIVVTGLGPGAAAAVAGPGVTLRSSTRAETVKISGARIQAAADTGPATYTVRSSPRSAGRKVTLRGLSIRGLLRLGGFDPASVDHITIVREDASKATLERADFAGSPFPEGPALVADGPGGTRYLRPVRGPRIANARDYIVASAAPLEISVDGDELLAVRTRVSPRRTTTGQTVAFSARVRFPPPGAALTYRWDFGDGTQGFGARVTHRYTREGELQARVIASGSGGFTAACEHTCGGTATASVRVGEPRRSARPDTTQGGGGSDSGAPGTGGAGSGSGGSGSRDGRGSASGRASEGDAPAAKPRRQAERAPRASAGETVSGILLADSGSAAKSSLPALRSGGQTTARDAGAGSQGSGRLGGSIALTLLLIVLGALHERRGGRLRVA